MNGFDDSVREVVVRAVRATFTSIGEGRLAGYLNLEGDALSVYVSTNCD